MDKDRIIAEIRRTTAENGGVPLGQDRFSAETGISVGVWRGKYWVRWSEAVTEAGYSPNSLSVAHPEETVIISLIKLIRENRRFPVYAELRMAKNRDPSFPGHGSISRLGTYMERVEQVRRYAASHPEYHDVLELLPAKSDATNEEVAPTEGVDGSVYMLKLGRHYKIGRSFRVPQRHQEITIELPEKPDVIHVITTDDPSGIEAYWHKRFGEKRTNGEWFALTRDDVRAFKRRRFM
jgi:hypothetical protein